VAIGPTTSGALADSLPTVLQSARIIREFAGVMPRLVDRKRLGAGEGLNWNEIALSQITAQDITETTKLENHQQLVDTLFTITPAQVGLSIKVTDRAKRKISQNVAALIGSLGQRAMNTKKDKNLLAVGASATTDLGAAGNPMTIGLVSAASSRITGNTTEPGVDMPKYFVGKSFHMKDLYDEITAGIGTYPIPAGLTEQTFRSGFRGSIMDVEAYVDDNITVDASSDAIALVFGRDAIVHVEGQSPVAYTDRDNSYGGGSEIMYMYDEYATGVRQQVWLYAVTADVTAPTS
jgi:hypothetical protein